jgi:small subunit ribosomal protein S1
LTTESSSPDAPALPAEVQAAEATPTPEALPTAVATAEAPIEDMASLLESVGAGELRQLRRGEVLEGHVMVIERDGLLVDIGYKSEGVVPQQEMLSLGADPLTKVQISDAILVYVTQPETAAGQVGLSIDRARGEQGWRVLQERFETGDVFEAEITGFNKGGLLANVEGVNAFIPMSQVVGAKPGSDGTNPLSAQVGRELQLKVIEINRRRNRVILSERAALQEWRAEQKDRLLDELAEGEIRTGTVASIRNFGVFIDLGGADGLVHLSELSWDRNAQPEELFKIGDEVSVYILRVDKESKKIALSIRRASPEQWEQMITQYAVGDVVPGVITKLVPFGAFARLPGPVEGLVHVSEIVERRIAHPEEVLEDGDVVPLKIVRIEHDRHRLGLSLREARDEAELHGWKFDSDGRVMTLSDDALEKFAEETAAVEARLEQRRTTETEQTATRAQEAASRPAAAGGGGTVSAAPASGPVLTAMQQAMQQAEARRESGTDSAADAEDEPAAEVGAEEATKAVAEEIVTEPEEAEGAAAEEAPATVAEEVAAEEAPAAVADESAAEVADEPAVDVAEEEAPEAVAEEVTAEPEADDSQETPAAE